jgi:hypothetical protein
LIFVFIWFVLFSAANNSQPSLFSSGDHLPKPAFTIGEYLVQALKIGVPLAAILAACLLVVLVFKRLSLKWVGALIGDLMQRLLLRLDFPGQSATKISDRPMWSAQPPVSVPTDLAEQMTVFDDSQSLAAVEILRREFYSALKSNDSAALPNFSEVMAAFELAHKNYFSSPLFRTLIVAALTEQPAFRVKTVFATDPDFIRMREWLKSSREPERKRENR